MPKDNEVDEKVVAYGRDLDGTGSLHPCAKGDIGAIALCDAATVAELRAEVERLVKALDEAACELSAAGQALAEFEGFEFRQKAAIDRAYAASQKAHDANGYTEALAKVTP